MSLTAGASKAADDVFSESEVTTLWRNTNLFIIIVIIT